MNDWYDDPEEDLPPSKTEIKRQMLELQKLGERIVKLSKGQLATIPIEDSLLAEAITTARRIKSHEGLRRQMQFIGKLLRETDTEAIEAAFKELESGRIKVNQQFHQLEKWRDRIVETGPSAVEEIMEKFPAADRQHLRQIVMQAGKEKKQSKPPAAAKKLFQYLRELDKQ